MTDSHRLDLFPITTSVVTSAAGSRLAIAACDLEALAASYDTPLYLYDRATLDAAVLAYRDALARHYGGPTGITYAGKAGLTIALAQWAAQHGLVVDCTGVGEMHVAVRAGVPRAQILVHGVNKSPADLAMALDVAGIIVVDNLSELARILATGRTDLPDLWLRVRPGAAVDTHAYRQTGQETSKFGMSATEAATAVRRCLDAGITPAGIHFHQGSHFHDPAPIKPGLDAVLDLLVGLRDDTGWTPGVLCPGGGWGIAYHEEDLPQPSVDAYVAFAAQALYDGCEARNLPLPALHMEPGRSLVARAGVALYRVGAVKQAGDRRWLLVDGGMADNIRPALYGARYSALPVCDPLRPATGPAWIGGPYCESGDVLIEDLPMADVLEGELLAVPAAGAYHISMSSNYNGACRPAVLWLDDGQAHLMRRRETPDDLVARDLPLP
ncbi:MAG: diaminopimelate decarboxylase [Caldilineaceae bacterium]|nr:diaminopimelate decarboxylase [Caldilineaceae bacterium]